MVQVRGRPTEYWGTDWHYTELEPALRDQECELCGNNAEFRAAYKLNEGNSGEPPTGYDALCHPCLEESVGFVALALWKKRCGL